MQEARAGSPKMPPVEIGEAELWVLYKSLPEPCSTAMLHKALKDKGVRCSLSWVKRKLKAMKLADPNVDPEIADAGSLIELLIGLGNEFKEFETLKGLQSRILSVMAVRMAKNSADPVYLEGLMKVYGMVTLELQKTYQWRLANSKNIEPTTTSPDKNPDDDDKEGNVTPFTRPGGKAAK